MMERTSFTARTALGVPIATFAERSMALSWAETDGRDFPGHFITKDTEITLTRSMVVRRDKANVERAA